MHICQITSMHPAYDGRIFERTCRELAKRGYKVTLIATCDEDKFVHGVQLLRIKPRKSLSRRLLSSYDAFEIARRLNADVYHFHDPELIPWMRWLAAAGKCVIFDKHENFIARFKMWGMPSFIAKWLEILYHAYERNSISKFAGVVAVSDSILELSSGARKDGVVIQNVPDVGRFRNILELDFKPRPYTIITSGSHSDHRNCRQTVQAMPYILERHPETKFCFVGSYDPDDYKDQLMNLACDLGVSGNLTLDDMLPWEENFMRLSKAHIGCVFYSDNINNRTTIPNRIFEYMMCGVVVLAHEFPELERIVNGSGCGLTLNTSDPNDIARKINRLLDNPAQIEEMSIMGRSAVNSVYNIGVQICGLEELYERSAARVKSENAHRLS